MESICTAKQLALDGFS